jgi:excinuclease UvrABC nuclease subunit
VRNTSTLANYFPDRSGCYIIRDGERVLYVGQSMNMRKRWITHHKRLVIERSFPNATVETVLYDGDLFQKETELIRELKPILNNKGHDRVYRENQIQPSKSNNVKRIAEERKMTFGRFAGVCLDKGLSYDTAKNMWDRKDKVNGWSGTVKALVSKILRHPVEDVFPT